jgi:hypothetical protein
MMGQRRSKGKLWFLSTRVRSARQKRRQKQRPYEHTEGKDCSERHVPQRRSVARPRYDSGGSNGKQTRADHPEKLSRHALSLSVSAHTDPIIAP